jgi:hypothetical protein
MHTMLLKENKAWIIIKHLYKPSSNSWEIKKQVVIVVKDIIKLKKSLKQMKGKVVNL